ncbi:DUF4185 domain-containing protein [Streptomyces winkii]|uniref:DUF4185 domain-containing protein n=1 Tax=Streptomyces winkii TaxID=3051178 RepID=UPI0028D12491|nr:DUF4185 domain-containing protein [Streptomyces sp. DSM 40971]
MHDHLGRSAGTGAGRRTVLRAGIATAVAAAGVGAGQGAAHAATGSPGASANVRAGATAGPRAINGTKIKNLTGPQETGAFGAQWTDLGIPVLSPGGGMLYLAGDTYDGEVALEGDWRAPVALRSSSTDPASLTIDGSVGGAHAKGLVPEDHQNNNTALPSDVFAIGDTLYMHLMRGPLHRTHHSDFWRSTDNGENWEYLCQWPGDMLGGQFQQKTYAVADDGYCYVLSSVFNRDVESGLLLHRVPHDRVGDPAAYEPWGAPDGSWGWGKAATTVTRPRRWGEICLRAMGGKYALSWLNMDPLDMRVQIFATPTSDLFATPEQTVIVPTSPGNESGNAVASPYGGFIVPGSTFEDFHMIVSQWYDNRNYRCMQYRINGLAA